MMKWLNKMFKKEPNDAEERQRTAQNHQRRRSSQYAVRVSTRRTSYLNPVTGNKITTHGAQRSMDVKVSSSLLFYETLN